jgi:uncharacterized membrane protein
MKMQIVILAVVLLLGCTSTDNVAAAPEGAQEIAPGPDTLEAVTDSVWISLSDISENAGFYEYDSGGVKVKYIAVKGSDGVVRTAFDACEVCYRAKKGYSQAGTDLVCNNCGLKFAIDGLGTKNKGQGCWPAYLPNEVKDGKAHIKKADLDAGSYLFG